MVLSRRPSIACLLLVLTAQFLSGGGNLWSEAQAANVQVEITEIKGYLLGPARNDVEVLFQLTNKGSETIVLEGAASPDAQSAIIHTTTIVQGKIKMRDVTAYNIPPGGTIRLATGGMHLMLNELQKPLKSGDHATVILKFRGGAEHAFRVDLGEKRSGEPPHPH